MKGHAPQSVAAQFSIPIGAQGLQPAHRPNVPSSIAISTAIAFRLVTFYLPPLWCSQAMSWLRRNAYV